MKAPAFWYDRSPNWVAKLLLPFGVLYGALTARRMARKGRRAAVPVICIGNFTAGGAGKTPTAIALARALQQAGEAPVFLTRGYGGTARGVVAVVPGHHDAAAVGDEALLLAAIAPTVVAADRVAGAAAATAAGASVILMDDGLQNPALAKDFTLVVVDGGVGFGNGLCMPAGPLRAPVEAQVPFVDAVLAIGMGKGITEAVAAAGLQQKPAFRANLSVDEAIADRLAGSRVLAFAGIGRPEKFFETLMGLYVKIELPRPYPDHHPYSEADAAEILALAEASGLTPVTTEKDRVRLTGGPMRDKLAAAAVVLPVTVPLPDDLVALVTAKLSLVRGGA